MATTEEKVEVIKPEAKPEAANKEPATASVEQEENPEPALKYKTWFLKVSVHCEGCKKKVKKILHNIDGVYKVDVDLRQQKATVMGNVDGETLVKILIKKTGKHAELLPEKADHKGKKKSKSKKKNKDKQSHQESSEEGGGDKSDKEQELSVKNEVFQVQDPSKSNAPPVGSTVKIGIDCGGNVVKPGEATGKTGGGVQFKEVMKNEGKPVVVLPAGCQSPAADQKGGGESENGGAGNTAAGGGSGGKKKKKNGHKGNNSNNNGDEGEHSGNAPAGAGSPLNHGQGYFSAPYPTVHSPPRQQIHNFPPHYYPQSPYPTMQSPPRHHSYAQPIYHHAPAVAVSHSTVHPSASYGGSYHAPRYEYAYMHPGTEIEPPPSDLYPYPSQPSDSFEFLSDENPNACSMM